MSITWIVCVSDKLGSTAIAHMILPEDTLRKSLPLSVRFWPLLTQGNQMSSLIHDYMSNHIIVQNWSLTDSSVGVGLIYIHCPTCTCRLHEDNFATPSIKEPWRQARVPSLLKANLSLTVVQCHWKGNPFRATVRSFWSNFTRSSKKESPRNSIGRWSTETKVCV